MLHLGEYYYNTTHHLSIGMSLFKALYSYEAISFRSFILPKSKVLGAKALVQQNMGIMRVFKDNLHHAQNQEKIYVEQNWTDWVFLRLQPYKQGSMTTSGAKTLKH